MDSTYFETGNKIISAEIRTPLGSSGRGSDENSTSTLLYRVVACGEVFGEDSILERINRRRDQDSLTNFEKATHPCSGQSHSRP